jgi:SAM-dependent methyltransferase
MIKKAICILKAGGISELLRATHSRLRGLMAGRANPFSTYRDEFVGKTGIEIGGPSQIFSRRGIFPVYPIIGHLDNCNFCDTTTWDGIRRSGEAYQFDPEKPAGIQHIVEATALKGLPSNSCDFVLSSHMLEHTANPMLALSELRRLLTDRGILVLVLPDKRHTFDHRRPVTTLGHLVDDFNAKVTEDDLTHLPEILALHDLTRDPEAGDLMAFRLRSTRNSENRCLHHHVFDMDLAIKLVEYVGFEVQAAEEVAPHHLLLVAKSTGNVLGSKASL